MIETKTSFTLPPDLLKRFVAAPFAAFITTPGATYQLHTNYAPLRDWLAGPSQGCGTRWECTVIYDPDYPIDEGEALAFQSGGLLLQLRPGRIVSIDSVHCRIVAFLSEIVPGQAAAYALMQELIALSQSGVTEDHLDETL